MVRGQRRALIELRGNMPRVPVYDLVSHPRDTTISCWRRRACRLDSRRHSSLHPRRPQVAAEPAHLLRAATAEQGG